MGIYLFKIIDYISNTEYSFIIKKSKQFRNTQNKKVKLLFHPFPCLKAYTTGRYWLVNYLVEMFRLFALLLHMCMACIVFEKLSLFSSLDFPLFHSHICGAYFILNQLSRLENGISLQVSLAFVYQKLTHLGKLQDFQNSSSKEKDPLAQSEYFDQKQDGRRISPEVARPPTLCSLPIPQTGWGQETREKDLWSLESHPAFKQLTWAGRSKVPESGGHMVGPSCRDAGSLVLDSSLPTVAQSSRGCQTWPQPPSQPLPVSHVWHFSGFRHTQN